MTKPRIAELFRSDWRRLDPPDLHARIGDIRRAAVREHLNQDQWRALDGMRARLAESGDATMIDRAGVVAAAILHVVRMRGTGAEARAEIKEILRSEFEDERRQAIADLEVADA
jgi:hypothetical protein